MTKIEKKQKSSEGRKLRESNRNTVASQIQSLPNNRFWHKAITPYQYRINDELDIYPTSKKYHNLTTQRRGVFTSLKEVIQTQLGITV